MSAFNNGTVALVKKVADMEKKMKTTEERLHTVEDLENKSAMRTAVRLLELEKENDDLKQQVAFLKSLYEINCNMYRDHVEDLSVEIHALKQRLEKIDPPINKPNTQNAEAQSNATSE